MKALLQTHQVNYCKEEETRAKAACLQLLRSNKLEPLDILIHSLPNKIELHYLLLEMAIDHNLLCAVEYFSKDRCIQLDYENGKIFHIATDQRKWQILHMLSRTMMVSTNNCYRKD